MECFPQFAQSCSVLQRQKSSHESMILDPDVCTTPSPDRVYTEVRSSVSVVTTRPSEALNLTALDPKRRATWPVWIWRPLVCRHQRVKGEETLSSTALISSNDLLSISQLLLRHDQKGTDHRGLFELHCSSLQPLHWSLLDERPGLRHALIYCIYYNLHKAAQSACMVMFRFFHLQDSIMIYCTESIASR